MLRRTLSLLFALTLVVGCNLHDPDSETPNGRTDTSGSDDTGIIDGDVDVGVDDGTGRDVADSDGEPDAQNCLYNSDCDDPPTDNEQCWLADCNNAVCEYSVPDPDVTCRVQSCSQSTLTATTTCGANGTCSQGGGTTDCSPYGCLASLDGCLSTCTSDGDCVDSHRCLQSECREVLTFDISISSDRMNFSLTEHLESQHGWNAMMPLDGTITIGPEVVIGSQSLSSPAFRIEPLPSHSRVAVVNEGDIVGTGGHGGRVVFISYSTIDFEPGESGGDAVHVLRQQPDVTIEFDNSSGLIGGGGGGGAPAGEVYSFNSKHAVGGGGGAGGPPGQGGMVPTAAEYRDVGRPGTLLQGGRGGGTHAALGGDGGNLGQLGRGSSGAIQGTHGNAGRAVVGTGYFTWVDQGEILGPTLP